MPDCDQITDLAARMIREKADSWFIVAPSKLVVLNPRLRAAFRFGVGGFPLRGFGVLTDKGQQLQDVCRRVLDTGNPASMTCVLRGRRVTIILHRMVCPLATPDCEEDGCAVVLARVDSRR